MNASQNTIQTKSSDPVWQAAAMLVAGMVVTACAKLLAAAGLLEISERFPWMSAAAFLLMFAVANSLSTLTAESPAKYWGRSIYSFMGLAFLSGLIAWAFSSLSINEAGSFRWIFIVLTIGYLVFLGIVNSIRRIVDFAQKEEWNQPRLRQRKRR